MGERRQVSTGRRRMAIEPQLFPGDLMQRAWRKNRALERWLDYLLRQGHSMVTMRAAHHAMASSASTDTLVTVR